MGTKARTLVERHNGKLTRYEQGENIAVDGSSVRTYALRQDFFDLRAMALEILQAPRGTKGDNFNYLEGEAIFSKWCGQTTQAGTLDAFSKALKTGEVPDMAVFTQARQQLGQSLTDEIQKTLSPVLGRVSQWDAYDGDLDTTRLDHEKPFRRRSRAMTDLRTLNVEYHIAASYSLSNEDLTRFGATVWATITALESMGVLCALRIVKHNAHVVGGAHDCLLDIKIKDCGQYVSDADLAFACHLMFYRKLAWGVFGVVADALSDKQSPLIKVSVGLTRPAPQAVFYNAATNALRFSMNKIDLGPDIISPIHAALRGNLNLIGSQITPETN